MEGHRAEGRCVVHGAIPVGNAVCAGGDDVESISAAVEVPSPSRWKEIGGTSMGRWAWKTCLRLTFSGEAGGWSEKYG